MRKANRYRTEDQRRQRRELGERGIEPAKGMGQNFMTDAGVAEWIVGSLGIEEGDMVVEIGPGMGALTRHLVERARRLVLLEKDDELVEVVRGTYGAREGVEVVHGDALEFDLRPYFRRQPLKVIGALPYSVGTEIVRRWLENPSPVQRAVFTLQKEVCDRLCAAPGTSDYGLLSVRTQLWWEAEMVRKLPPDIFVPRPKVDSGVVVLKPRDRAGIPAFDGVVMDRLLRAGFSQRRKMLRNLLPPGPGGDWVDIAGRAGISETARGQELAVGQWVALVQAWQGGEVAEAQRDDEIFDVVDGENRVTGQATRADVHARGWRHRAVHIFVENVRGEIFLQKRSHLKDKMPGKWDSSAAGHLDAGEAYLPCAVRELGEELGIRTEPGRLRLAGAVPAGPGTGMEFVELYLTRWDGALRWPPAEIESGMWMSPGEIDAWTAARPEDFADGFLECWRVYRAGSGRGIP
jgi:16S rRNA (adenine1518-N6/adenine1519-N6)-dimethyltransferase